MSSPSSEDDVDESSPNRDNKSRNDNIFDLDKIFEGDADNIEVMIEGEHPLSEGDGVEQELNIENSVEVPNDSVVVMVDEANFVIYTNMEYSLKTITEWGFEELVEIFKGKKIDIAALKFMTLADVDALIPIQMLGTRIKFRQRLLEWRIENVSTIHFMTLGRPDQTRVRIDQIGNRPDWEQTRVRTRVERDQSGNQSGNRPEWEWNGYVVLYKLLKRMICFSQNLKSETPFSKKLSFFGKF